jgi:hypothetical protein
MSDPWDFRKYIAGIILALLLFIASDEGRRAVSPRNWLILMGAGTIGIAWLLYPYVWHNTKEFWERASSPVVGKGFPYWPLAILLVTIGVAVGITWLWTYSHLAEGTSKAQVSSNGQAAIAAQSNESSEFEKKLKLQDERIAGLARSLAAAQDGVRREQDMAAGLKAENAQLKMQCEEHRKTLPSEEQIRKTQFWEANTLAIYKCVETARQFTETEGNTRLWKACSMAISVLKSHSEMQVNSEEELERWILQYDRKKEMINNVAGWLFGHSLGMEDMPPQGRPIAPYRSLNSKHNDYLNEINYHIERLKGIQTPPTAN